MSATTPMRTRRSTLRRAFTLVEIMTSLAILGIIGLGFVRLIVSQARFTEGQMALRNARSVSRNAMNIMLTDLRMVQDSGGLRFGSRDSVTVRVPVAFGLLCANTAGTATISLLPVDSAMIALGQYSGWAYRDSVSGQYVYNDATTPTRFGLLNAGIAGTCTNSAVVLGVAGPGITPLTFTLPSGATRTGRVVSIGDPVVIGATNHGWPVFLYQQITYKFANSTAYPGRIGLFRKVRAADPMAPVVDEIIAPFDPSARFRFYVLNSDAAQDTMPTDPKSVRGLELVLAGSSPRAQQGMRAAEQALVTGVFFKNRRDP